MPPGDTGGTGMRVTRTIGAALAAVLVAGLLVTATSAPAGADTALVDYSCDIPPVNALIQSQVPDPALVEDLEVTMVDTPDPVVQGQPVHYDIDYPVLDPTEGLPPAPPEIGTYGTVRIKYVEIAAALPAGLSGVTASFETPVPWATISITGGVLKVRIESPVSGSYITIEPDLTPPTIKIEDSPGHWIDFDAVPSVNIEGTASGAAGTSIDWRPPTLTTVVKYKKVVTVVFFPVTMVDWNDASLPCVPVDPNQIVASTLIEAPNPQVSVSVAADETAVEAGETVHWTVTATNTGNVPLAGAIIADIPGHCGELTSSTLAVGASATATCARTTGVGDVGGLSLTGTVDTTETSPVSGTASTTVGPVAPPTVSLTLDPADETAAPGETLDYALTVTEHGVLPLTGVTATGEGIVCDLGAGTCEHLVRNWEQGPYPASVEVDAAEVDPVTATATTATAAIPPHGFSDVAGTAYVDDGVDYAKFFGLVTGYPGNLYQPATSVNRGQIVNMLWQLMDQPGGSPPHGFGDIPSGAFYEDGLRWAKAEGLVTGFPGNRYLPRDPVNRCQLVNMVWNMVGAPTGSAPSGYTDVAPARFCRPAIDWARAQGLVAGFAPATTFRPSRAASRGEVAYLLHRLALTEPAWAAAGSVPGSVLFDPTG